MKWDVEYTNEFGAWWTDLMEAEQEDVAAVVELLMEQGPRLSFPHSSGVQGSSHGHMRELRIQSGGKPIRVFLCCRSVTIGDLADWQRQVWKQSVLSTVCANRRRTL